MTRSRSSLTAAVLAGTLLVVGGCADLPSAAAPVDAAGLEKIAAPAGPARSLSGEALAAKMIGPMGGELVTTSGHRIVFPVGALARPTEISIRDDAKFVGVHLEPHGLRFPAGRGPVLTLSLSGAETAGYAGLGIVYVDESGNVLEVLRATVEGATAYTTLRHFSGYIAVGH